MQPDLKEGHWRWGKANDHLLLNPLCYYWDVRLHLSPFNFSGIWPWPYHVEIYGLSSFLTAFCHVVSFPWGCSFNLPGFFLSYFPFFSFCNCWLAIVSLLWSSLQKWEVGGEVLLYMGCAEISLRQKLCNEVVKWYCLCVPWEVTLFLSFCL